MKANYRGLFIVLSVILITTLMGCVPGGMSASECMSKFKSIVNSGSSNFEDLKAYTHSGASMYNQAGVQSFWETYFDGNGSFSHTMMGTTAIVTEDGGSYTFYLEAEESGFMDMVKDYKVRRITYTAGGATVFN